MKKVYYLTAISAALLLIAPLALSAADGVYTNGTLNGSYKKELSSGGEGAQYRFLYTVSKEPMAPLPDPQDMVSLELGLKAQGENVGDRFGSEEPKSERALPIDLYAVEFDVDPTTGIAVIDFYASRPPVWGSLFEKGSDSQYWAYNSGFNAQGERNISSDNLLAFTVGTPTATTTVTIHNPEPGTLLIMGSGLALAAAGRRFKKMKRAD